MRKLLVSSQTPVVDEKSLVSEPMGPSTDGGGDENVDPGW